MRILQIPVYKFSELSDDAKEKALEKMREIEARDDFGADCVIEDAKAIGAILGIDINKIYYSGFWCQGDGACFEGTYEYKAGSEKAIKDYAPCDGELHAIARDLRLASASHFYKLETRVAHSGHYYHKFCNVIESRDRETGRETESEAIAKALRDFMDWIYKQLKKEYEYRTSDTAILGRIEDHDYDFYKDGRLA